jgi:hypothetical protein
MANLENIYVKESALVVNGPSNAGALLPLLPAMNFIRRFLVPVYNGDKNFLDLVIRELGEEYGRIMHDLFKRIEDEKKKSERLAKRIAQKTPQKTVDLEF